MLFRSSQLSVAPTAKRLGNLHRLSFFKSFIFLIIFYRFSCFFGKRDRIVVLLDWIFKLWRALSSI